MKYRRLDKEELKTLEKEFIQFLAAHSIPAEDWDRMKSTAPEEAEQWLDKFSDFVFEKTLTDVDFMELRQPHTIQIVQVNTSPFLMRGIRVIGNQHINFLDQSSPQTWQKLLQEHGGKLQTFQATKTPEASPNEEKFKLMNAGYLILRDPKLFHTLAELQKE